MSGSELIPTTDSAITANQSIVPSNRIEVRDQRVTSGVEKTNLSNRLFVRLIAKDKTFTRVNFKYSIFDTCYLRDCVFDSCDFTGCRFIATNLTGSKFEGCRFDYAVFERTLIAEDILDSGCPSYENLKLRFARSLRVNFQQIGNADGVNKAIKVELQATEIHFRKTWNSNESYYRKKYAGIRRVKAFLEWSKFKVFDFIWGNGESLVKLGVSVLMVLLFMTLVDVLKFHNPLSVVDYVQALRKMPQVFLGILTPTGYPGLYVAAITTVRLIALALFVSVLVKRLNRR